MDNRLLEFQVTIKGIVDSSDLMSDVGRIECRKRLKQFLSVVNKAYGLSREKEIVAHLYIDGKSIKPKLEIFCRGDKEKMVKDKLVELRKDPEKNWESIKVFESYQKSIESI